MQSLTETLASYAPPLVVARFADEPASAGTAWCDRLPGAMLFADVSGFTALAERLAARGAEGAEALSAALNTYFGLLITLIEEHGGQVISFPGDAVIALWLARAGREEREACARRAATCGLAIVEGLNDYEVSAEVRLSLKAALGAGTTWVGTVGDGHERRFFLAAGDAQTEVRTALGQARSGELVAGAEAWELITDRSAGQPRKEGCVKLERIDAEPPRRAAARPTLLPESEAALRGFVPRPALARIEFGQAEWLAELRRVTVLFVSLDGIDYGTVNALGRVQELLQATCEVIDRYRGSVNQVVVDDKGTILVTGWGQPTLTHENDALRALLAASEIQSELRELGAEGALGVATGRAFCGTRGNDSRREYLMTGSIVNLAARLMVAAQGTVLCDEATFEAAQAQTVGKGLSFQPMPSFLPKGKTEPVTVYRVGSPQRSAMPTVAMFQIGRRDETAALDKHLKNDGGVVLVEGEPGIGKSVLVVNLLEQARRQGLPCLSGAADAIEQATPYFAWQSVFGSLFAVDEWTRNRESQRQKVLQRLAELDPELVELAPLLNPVLGLEFPATELTAGMRGEVRATNTQGLLTRLLTTVTGSSSTSLDRLIALEDVHWLDSASWALVHRICREVPSTLLVLTARPLSEPLPETYRRLVDWPRTTRIHLGALDRESTKTLLCERLGVHEVAEEIVDFVQERSGGNPFYSEELAYTLRDGGQIVISDRSCRPAPGVEDLGTLIPESVEGTVRTRIDQLSPLGQLTLKVASVIGRVFLLRLLRDVYPVAGDRSELPAALEFLKIHGLVLLGNPSQDLEYFFKHAITKEVAYELLLFAQRRKLHHAIAEWYERQTVDLNPFYSILSYHWSRAEVADKAIYYLDKAGQHALENDANHEAVSFFSRAGELDRAAAAEELPEAAARRLVLGRARRHFGLAEAYFRVGLAPESEEHCRRAVELLTVSVPSRSVSVLSKSLPLVARQLARRLGPRGRADRAPAADLEQQRAYLLYEAHYLLLKIAFFRCDTNLTVYATLSTLHWAESLGPSPQLAQAYATMSLGCGVVPNHRLARFYQKKALETIREFADEDSIQLGQVLVPLCVYVCGIGNWEQAQEYLTKALRIFEKNGDHSQWGLCMQMLCRTAAHQGQFRRLAELCEIFLADAKRRDALWEQVAVHNNQIERVLLTSNDVEEVFALAEEARGPLRESQEISSELVHDSLMAVAQTRIDDFTAAWETATKAVATIRGIQPTSFGIFVAYASTAAAFLACWEAGLKGSQETRTAVKALKQFARIFPLGEPRAFLYEGLEMWLLGKRTPAFKLWRKALLRARQLEMPYEIAAAHFEIGRHPGSSAAERRRHLSAAAEGFEQLGVLYDLEKTRATLDRVRTDLEE